MSHERPDPIRRTVLRPPVRVIDALAERGMRAQPIRAAALVALVQGLAHGALVLSAKPTHGPAEQMVVDTMKQYAFDFSGAHRSYWDLYFGYALLAAGACLAEAALLWLVAPMAYEAPQRLRRLVLLIVLANVAHALMVVRFFFFVPMVPDVLVIGLLAMSLARSAPATAP
jgi:hypothetical protein